MKLEHVMDIQVNVGKPLEVGMTPQGMRRIIPITGGTFEGPRLKGVVLPGGADWQVIDANYHTQLEARYSLQTDDGIVIAVINRGVPGSQRSDATVATRRRSEPCRVLLQNDPHF